MTRVLFLIPGLGPGGAELSLAQEIPRLTDCGIDASVACFKVRRPGVHDLVRSVAPVHVIDSGPATRMWELRALTRRVRPDLIHTSVLPADVAGRLVGLATGTPVVSTLVNTAHSQVRLHDPAVSRLAFRAYRLADAATAQLCVGFRALTPAVREASAKSLRVSSNRVVVIPRGRDLKALAFSDERRQRARWQLGLDPDAFVIGNVARQEYQKGLDTLVRAFSRFRRVVGSAVLVQAGRAGSQTKAITQIASDSGLNGGAVRLLGYRQDVTDSVLPALDAFAFPSRYEGFGGALLEAAASGLPIVASDLPALRDVLGDAATFVEPDDVGAWAQAFMSVYSRGVRPPVAEVVSQIQRFDISVVGQRVADWLRQSAEAEQASRG